MEFLPQSILILRSWFSLNHFWFTVLVYLVFLVRRECQACGKKTNKPDFQLHLWRMYLSGTDEINDTISENGTLNLPVRQEIKSKLRFLNYIAIYAHADLRDG